MVPPEPNLSHPALVEPTRPSETVFWLIGRQQRRQTLLRVTGTDLYVAEHAWVAAIGADLPGDVLLRLDFDGTSTGVGELRVLARPDRPLPVTSSRLRKVPVEALVTGAVERRVTYTMGADGKPVATFGDPVKDQYRLGLAGLAGRQRRRTPDDDLERAARVYAAAVADHQAPTAAVRRELNLTSDGAKKIVQRARKAGHLPAALGERLGGIPKQTDQDERRAT
ncbi:MAG: hypothetical protein ACR2NJ_06970 [Acidimicrobiales bacterium]